MHCVTNALWSYRFLAGHHMHWIRLFMYLLVILRNNWILGDSSQAITRLFLPRHSFHLSVTSFKNISWSEHFLFSVIENKNLFQYWNNLVFSCMLIKVKPALFHGATSILLVLCLGDYGEHDVVRSSAAFNMEATAYKRINMKWRSHPELRGSEVDCHVGRFHPTHCGVTECFFLQQTSSVAGRKIA